MWLAEWHGLICLTFSQAEVFGEAPVAGPSPLDCLQALRSERNMLWSTPRCGHRRNVIGYVMLTITLRWLTIDPNTSR